MGRLGSAGWGVPAGRLRRGTVYAALVDGAEGEGPRLVALVPLDRPRTLDHAALRRSAVVDRLLRALFPEEVGLEGLAPMPMHRALPTEVDALALWVPIGAHVGAAQAVHLGTGTALATWRVMPDQTDVDERLRMLISHAYLRAYAYPPTWVRTALDRVAGWWPGALARRTLAGERGFGPPLVLTEADVLTGTDHPEADCPGTNAVEVNGDG